MTQPIPQVIQVLILDTINAPDLSAKDKFISAKLILDSAIGRGWIDMKDYLAFTPELATLANAT